MIQTFIVFQDLVDANMLMNLRGHSFMPDFENLHDWVSEFRSKYRQCFIDDTDSVKQHPDDGHRLAEFDGDPVLRGAPIFNPCLSRPGMSIRNPFAPRVFERTPNGTR